MSNTEAQSMSPSAFFGAPESAPATAPEPAATQPQSQPIEAFLTPAPQAEPQQVQPAPVVTPPEASPQPQQQHQVPVAHLVEERRARQAAERERSELLQAVRELTAAQQRQFAQTQPAPQPIDPEVDPVGAYRELEARTAHTLHVQALNFSEQRARDKHGDELVDKAIDAAIETGYNKLFLNRPDAYKDLLSWYQGQQVHQEIGDPAAYRAKIEAEVRANLLAQIRAGTQPPTNIPPSLGQAGNASAASSQVVPDSREFFGSMMSKRPPNRG